MMPAATVALRNLSTPSLALVDHERAPHMLDDINAKLSPEDISRFLEMLQQHNAHHSHGDLATSESARVAVFESVSPAVVFISTSLVHATFGVAMQVGAGSGFVWDAEGHIVTNYHVVAGRPQGRWGSRGGANKASRKVMIKLEGVEEAVEATVVGQEPDKDLAVLKIDPSGLPAPLLPLRLAPSSELKVGQSVLAIGAPFGLDRTLTSGIVSAVGRDIDGAGGRPIRDCIQTDAAINPGNSGGPLLDSSGNLIGVNTMIYAPSGNVGNVGIGFAVPSDTVQRIVQQIVDHGPNARPSLGVSVMPDHARALYGRQTRRALDGALIAQVVPGGPAEALGFTPCTRGPRGDLSLGDLITHVDGTPVRRNEDLLCKVEEAEAGVPMSLTLMRGCDPRRVEEVLITPVRRAALMESLGEMEQQAVRQQVKEGAHQRMRRDW